MRYIICFLCWWVLLCWRFKQDTFTIKKTIPFNQIGKTLKHKVLLNRNERMRAIKGESFGVLKKTLYLWELEISKNKSWNFYRFAISTSVMAIIGVAVGATFNNVGMSVILAIGSGMLPYHLLCYQNRKFETCKQEQLLIVLATIQSEYSKPGVSFVIAVKNALPSIPSHLYESFKVFCDTLLLLSPDSPQQAYRELDKRVGHYFFTEYLSLARLVEDGESGLKATMAAIPEAYQHYLDYNRVYRNQVAVLNDQFLMTLLALPMMLSFLKGISKNYYQLLTESGIGKLTLFVITSAFILAGIIFGKYNQPVEFEI